jgi:hypothetical protein
MALGSLAEKSRTNFIGADDGSRVPVNLTRVRFLPGKLFQKPARGTAGQEGDKNNLSTRLFDNGALSSVQGAQRVIAAFHINVWFSQLKESGRSSLLKNANGADGFQARQNEGPIRLGIDRASRPFQVSHGLISIETDQQEVAFCSGVFEVSDVPGVKQIKAAVRYDQALPGSSDVGAPCWKVGH